MILKTIALLSVVAASIAVAPEPPHHEDRSEDFSVYKSVEHFSDRDYYGKPDKKEYYDKHNKKDHYEKKNKYYDEGKQYKKQKYYKDGPGNKPYKKEKNYNKHWEDKDSKRWENEERRWEDKEPKGWEDKEPRKWEDKEPNRWEDKEPRRWEDKVENKWEEYPKYNEKEYRHHEPSFMDVNEIDSNDFHKEKYNKYDKHSKHPNHFEDSRKNLEFSHHDKYPKNEEKYFEREKKHKDKSYPPHKEHPKKKYDLQADTNVNYLYDRPVNPDSEFIDVKNPGKHVNKENYEAHYQSVNDEVFKRVKKDFYKEMKTIDLSKPPPSNETVLMARYIIHNVEWAALATVSARNPTKGTPFANIKSVSDGPVNKGSGVPFFYLTPRDLSSQDLNKDNRCTVTVTLAETSYCRNENYDPEDPRCARLILTGKIKRVKPGTTEEEFAKDALFSRHPAMSKWPADHEWFFAKLKIGQIVLLDQFGGPKYIDVQEYLNVEPPPART